MTRRRSVTIGATAGLTCAALAAAAWLHPRPRLIWNASASAPLGLYRLAAISAPRAHMLVAIMPPPGLARWLARRHYLALATPLIKHVAARQGALVCREGARVTIGGRLIARARMRDSQGRVLPVWSGCRIVARNAVFVLNDVPDSLDSRYFGALPTAGLLGQAIPLLTRDVHGSHAHWHLTARAAFALSDSPAAPGHRE